MAELNPLRQIARHSPPGISNVAEYLAGALHDVTLGAADGFRGDPLEYWDPEYIRATQPLLKTAFGTYFRGEARGLENIPKDGPALLVGNHSGGTYIADTFVFAQSFYDYFGPDRRFHQLAHDIAARLPGPAGGMIRRYGTVPANHDNARRAFDKGAPVLVYPGGDYETFRPSWHSDRIEFGGRKGFIRLALEQNVPIVPVVAIGGQETALFVTRGERIAKLTGLQNLTRIKVFPIQLAPPFGVTILDLPGRIPLPSKVTIEVLPPIDLKERFGASARPKTIYDAVTGEMQDALDGLSEERSVPVLG